MKLRTFACAPGVGRKLVVLAITCTAMFAAVPAVASATAVWVSPATPAAPFNSCASPGYSSIQQAISVNAPSTTVHICAGTYKEQLTIEHAVTLAAEPGAKLQLPASPAITTLCAAANETALVNICGTGTVKITGLSIEGNFPITGCGDETYDVIAGGNAKLVMSAATVVGPEVPSGLKGCQTGVAIQVGRHFTGQVATATITNTSVSEYNKNGITVDNVGSAATIKGGSVTNIPSPIIATNGIQISRGAVGKVIETAISGNECNAGSCGPGAIFEQATGVLFYEAGSGSSVAKANLSKNDIGVYHSSKEETTKPQVGINSNTLSENRYEGVVLDQGYAVVNKNTITGPANVGIMLLQYAGGEPQAFGPRGKGSEDTISGMTVHAVEGLSDNEPGDQFGSFTITKSAISGNPAPTVAGSVFTNNPEKLKIITTASDT
jgi:nitrous oxidase accessory protein NosD